jgi:hypothetical protein
MKIRYCPHCVELVHFEAEDPLQRCWNCRRVSNFALVKSPEQRLGVWLLGQIEGAGQAVIFFCLRPLGRRAAAAVAKVVLVEAIPAVVVMLLVSNSFDIRVVHDLAAPFLMPS